jgi:hypothetical protein
MACLVIKAKASMDTSSRGCTSDFCEDHQPSYMVFNWPITAGTKDLRTCSTNHWWLLGSEDVVPVSAVTFNESHCPVRIVLHAMLALNLWLHSAMSKHDSQSAVRMSSMCLDPPL